jgi:hypothetical protein
MITGFDHLSINGRELIAVVLTAQLISRYGFCPAVLKNLAAELILNKVFDLLMPGLG